MPPMVKYLGGITMLFVIVLVGKGLGRHGTVLRGGLVSGHAAYGFFFATSVFFMTDNLLVASIGILLACIIAQSRWEAKFHTIFELTLGALVGVIVAVLIFGFTPQ